MRSRNINFLRNCFLFPIKKNTVFTPFYYIFLEGYNDHITNHYDKGSSTNSAILLTKGKNITRRAPVINEDGGIFAVVLKTLLVGISYENIDAISP
jgi:hypothetical protein